ncbi:hypothetical protein HYPDE_26688 [Hyphomicrobium denitrificans 1NES1]|uniref:GmrSD restriction endonucleases N-terminal domain-containing protein n=1 Tax=Hyphomicrobium denitrificans 1NES1 TaxID=670307 RepID=N0B265_9HYPH|nr:DUF262 domain-containing protein [Hyphomicrobium denitrificans]AGK57018.1 hypothetical protein HYPDE_26688 [Hyphomicrobium denitrificans 1NES1]
MSTQRYTVTQLPIETLLTWVKSGEIAIPEIQRPFVWEPTKVRNLLDSLYSGYPVGYLIAWRNPTVRLKDGTPSAGKRILIDGQQRVTALMASLLGLEVLTQDYTTTRIRIAFHPLEEKFEVANPAIEKNAAWLPDIAELFSPNAKLLQITKAYAAANKGVDADELFNTLEKLKKIINNPVGVIELAEDLDIDTVTEIFIRVNSAGKSLSQADFAMSKIAANESYGGNELRKAIDYFCHLAVAPEFLARIEKGDPKFSSSDLFLKMRWLKGAGEPIYDPSYTDVLRVAFTSEFVRGKLQDLVALLSGRNFETKQYEDQIAEQSFAGLKRGIENFISETHFKRFTMILQSAGFITRDLFVGRNAVNFAYIAYLKGRSDSVAPADLERIVRRWYALSLLTERYTTSPETAFDRDIREISKRGLLDYVNGTIDAELPDNYWTNLLPNQLETSSSTSPFFFAFQAAQVKLGDKGFLSRDITVRDLLLNRSDVHHIFPQEHLKKQGMSRGRYNQIANFAIAQSEINIAIRDKAPDIYFAELAKQCNGGQARYGGISDEAELRDNLETHCLPDGMLDGKVPSYDTFLEFRRGLMANKIKEWFQSL